MAITTSAAGTKSPLNPGALASQKGSGLELMDMPNGGYIISSSSPLLRKRTEPCREQQRHRNQNQKHNALPSTKNVRRLRLTFRLPC